MHNNTPYSDEHLNAFIDDQLDATEKAEILDAVRHDAELSQRVCKLQKLKNLLQLSYESIEIPDRHKETSKFKQPAKIKWFVAASFFLAIGSIAGWVSHQTMSPQGLLDIAQITQPQTASNDSQNWNLMLHVSTANPKRLNIVLNEAEALLEEYARSERKLELEILTNSEGLALVNDTGKDYNVHLQKLQQKYDNIAVMVCGQTLKRIQREQGKNLTLLPNAKVVPSAINQIINRQKSGWSYIRI